MVIEEYNEPKNRDEALARTDREKWIKAMDEEIKSLNENQTLELKELPMDRKIIGCKWVFKKKENAEDGTIKFKARLVAQGFTQKYGTDYDEVFAQVVRPETFRLLLTIAGKRRLYVYHFDAGTAFLNGKLEESIYIKQPDEYKEEGNKQLVCKLIKSIYGLKQAAKVWKEKIHAILQQLGFKQSKADACLYWRQSAKGFMYVAIYVDDILVASAHEKEIHEIARRLEGEFNLTRLGQLTNYLGIKIQRDDRGIYYINQEKYITKIIQKFGLQDAKPSKVPLESGYTKDDFIMKRNKNSKKMQ